MKWKCLSIHTVSADIIDYKLDLPSTPCECGMFVSAQEFQQHARSAPHLQWAITKYRFDIARRCEYCGVVYPSMDCNLHHCDKMTCQGSSSEDIDPEDEALAEAAWYEEQRKIRSKYDLRAAAQPTSTPLSPMPNNNSYATIDADDFDDDFMDDY